MDYTNKKTNNSFDKTIKIDYEYKNDTELSRYLDDLSYMIYGVSHLELSFLNGNKTDFSKTNILINPN